MFHCSLMVASILARVVGFGLSRCRTDYKESVKRRGKVFDEFVKEVTSLGAMGLKISPSQRHDIL